MTHVGAPAFDDHWDHSIFYPCCKCVCSVTQSRNRQKNRCVWLASLGLHCFGHCCKSPRPNGSNKSMTVFPQTQWRIPSMSRPASNEVFSASVLLCETALCFSHDRETETHVWLPRTHKTPSDVNLESVMSPAKSWSWNGTNLHSLALFPTWQYCLWFQVWWMWLIDPANRVPHALFHFVTDLVK